MDAVTYPDTNVQQYLADHFACLKINLFDKHPDFKTAIGNTKVMWSPAMIFTDGKNRELRRYTGWMPAASFLAQLRLSRAMHEMNRVQFDAARTLLGEILDEFGSTEVVPEALYYHGITGFLAGGKDMAALRESWERLAKDHAGTPFATYASVIEDVPVS